jgi:hypothetical protein
MKSPSSTQERIQAMIEKIRSDEKWKDGIPPRALWGYMLDMIYTGNTETAKDMFEKAWLAETEGKSEFLSTFHQQLATSLYYE